MPFVVGGILCALVQPAWVSATDSEEKEKQSSPPMKVEKPEKVQKQASFKVISEQC